jgi:hypothetical protein
MPAVLPVPSATSLTPAERAEFARSGYLRLAGRFAAGEVAAWRAECDRLLGLTDHIHPDNLRVEMAGGRVWKFDPLVDISPVFAALARDPRITAPLGSL